MCSKISQLVGNFATPTPSNSSQNRKLLSSLSEKSNIMVLAEIFGKLFLRKFQKIMN